MGRPVQQTFAAARREPDQGVGCPRRNDTPRDLATVSARTRQKKKQEASVRPTSVLRAAQRESRHDEKKETTARLPRSADCAQGTRASRSAARRRSTTEASAREEKKRGGGGCSAEVGKSPHARYYSLTRSSRSVWGGSEERRPPHPPRLLTPWGSNKSEEKPYIIIYVYFRVLITPRPWVRGASDGPPSRSSVLSLLWLTLIHLTLN